MAHDEPVKDAWQRIRRHRVTCFHCRASAMCEPVGPNDAWLCDKCARREIDGQMQLW